MAQKQERRIEDEIYYSERVHDDKYEYRFGFLRKLKFYP